MPHYEYYSFLYNAALSLFYIICLIAFIMPPQPMLQWRHYTIQYNTIQFIESSNKRTCSNRFVNVTIVSSK